jgi:TonB family protein
MPVAKRVVLIAAGMVWLVLCVPAQTNAPPAGNGQQATPPVVSPPEGHKESSSPGQVSLILSETLGVDFAPYLNKSVLPRIRDNWCPLMPEEAKSPIRKKGEVAIEFSILKDGSVAGMRLDGSTADTHMERAAWGGILNSNPFPPLPAEFEGKYIKLQLLFTYNVDHKPNESASHIACLPSLGISPSGPVTVVAGSTQQFSASVEGGGIATVKWAIGGDQCAKSDCGTVSPSGLYTAPGKLPEPPNIVVTATQTSEPFTSASTHVTIIAPSSTNQ